jgi:hypothetical protein
MATFTVTNFVDSGSGSFRQAIFDANTQAGVDEIIFDTSGVPSTITLTSGELNITDSVNILGQGANLLTVSGNNNSRIFNINDGGSDIIDVLISGLTLTDGTLTDLTDGHSTSSGGAIFNADENLSLVDAVITGNTVTHRGPYYSILLSGGGIYNHSGHLSIVNSTINNNSLIPFQAEFSSDHLGGGIFNGSGNVTITNSTIAGNTVVGGTSGFGPGQGNGGGIYNHSGVLSVNHSSISGNSAQAGLSRGNSTSGNGGGIYNHSGSVDVNNSIISDNRVQGGSSSHESGNGNGGGIFNGSGDLIVRNSTISGNTAEGGSTLFASSSNAYGGGIWGEVTVINSTISANTAVGGSVFSSGFGDGGDGYGGGIWGSGEVLNSTITGNTAIGGIGCSYDNYIICHNGIGVGSGIANTDTITITSSIVAGNTNTDDIYGGFTSGGNNLIGINPLLSPLQNNGGFTETHALLPGSPAIDAGSNPLGLLSDQRGSGFNRTVGSQTDIGAFEVHSSTSVPEPSSIFGLVGLVILGTGSLLRRKRQNKS